MLLPKSGKIALRELHKIYSRKCVYYIDIGPERLGRTKKSKQVKEVVYPTTFRMKEGTEELDDPFGQAEYAYSLIET